MAREELTSNTSITLAAFLPVRGFSSWNVAAYLTGGGVRGRVLAGQTLEGPFSAVSTSPIAGEGAFFSTFRDLQD